MFLPPQNDTTRRWAEATAEVIDEVFRLRESVGKGRTAGLLKWIERHRFVHNAEQARFPALQFRGHPVRHHVQQRRKPVRARVRRDAAQAGKRVRLPTERHMQAIVVGGDLSAAGAPLVDGIREAVDRYAQPGIAQAVMVTRGVLGDRAEVLGALTLVIGDTQSVRSGGLAALAG